MATSRSGKSKSTGLRILWIPGKRKSHPKGRYESTSKQVSYNTGNQKKNQMWSLGGSKSQKDLIESDPDSSLFDGPSVSRLTPLAACSATVAAAKIECAPTDIKVPISDGPLTPSSSSTALLISIPNSPEPTVTATINEEIMPAAKLPSPVTTTVAEIAEENRYAILSHQNGIDDIDDVYDLPTPPKNDTNWRNNMRLNTSGETTNSIATTISSTSPNSEAKSDTNTPTKKKSRNHNNNQQGDVNSIESVSDSDHIPKLEDLDWIDELVLEHNAKEMLRKTSKHKKKKQHTTVEKLDQLDGVPSKHQMAIKEPEKIVEDDDKLVKCLYFTLMCCECSIS